MLANFISSAFDWARQVQVTPLRLDYVKRKETELFNVLLVFSNKKQEDISYLILQTLVSMREELISAAVKHDLSSNQLITSFIQFIEKFRFRKV